MKNTLKAQLINLALPLLFAAYPVLFLYSVNAWNLQLDSLKFPLGASLLVAIVVFAIFQLLQRNPISAGLSAAVFVIVYYFYGIFYRSLIKWDLFRVQHFWLLPLVIALTFYVGYLITRFKRPAIAQANKILVLVALLLVGYNLVNILSVEVKRDWLQSASTLTADAAAPSTQKHPDIYYIIFDEYAGFDAVKGYWQDNYFTEFEDFLNKNHFFDATGSRSLTINTETELATRLNLHQYTDADNPKTVLNVLENNKVMQILKTYGYETVVMDMAFTGFKADDNIKFDPEEVGGMATDEFKQTFINDSMFIAFSDHFNYGSTTEKQRNMITFALNKTSNLPEIKSPKFVFTHVLLPHMPFIFDESGNLLDSTHNYDWAYYLGQHKYTTKLAEDLITRLLKNADPDNPPVIIIQSDHGARNLQSRTKDNVYLNGYLQNYNMDYAHDILNALYLPGVDYSTLSNNMAPIDTFMIVLNHYLNAGVSVDQTK